MGPGFKIETYKRFTLLGPRWFFRIRDFNNGEILLPSQPYKSPWSRDQLARRMSHALKAPITEVAR